MTCFIFYILEKKLFLFLTFEMKQISLSHSKNKAKRKKKIFGANNGYFLIMREETVLYTRLKYLIYIEDNH